MTGYSPFPADISAARAKGVLRLSRSPITTLWTARIPLAGWERSARNRHELFEGIRKVLDKHCLTK